MAGLDNVKHTLDISAINRAVDLLTQARKISFLALAPLQLSRTTQ